MTIKQIQIAAPKKAPAKKAPAKKAAPKKNEKPKLGKGANEPTAYFESLERNKKGSMKVMKKQWSKAVKLAEAEGKGKKGPYIMRIFKNLMGISTASTETAVLSEWKVLFSYKDPSGKGIASGTQVRKSSSADGARKGATLWAKRVGKEGFSITRVVKADAGGLPGIGNEPTGVDTVAPPGGPVGNFKYFTKDDARQAAKRATAATLVGEDDSGKPIKLDLASDAEEVFKNDTKGGKRMLNKQQLWSAINQANAYLRVNPNKKGAVGRADYNQKVFDAVLDLIKKSKTKTKATAHPFDVAGLTKAANTSGTTGELQTLLDQARKQAEEMEKIGRGSPQYEDKQREMQRILKAVNKLDPEGNSKFDYLVWQHSAKPFRKSRSL